MDLNDFTITLDQAIDNRRRCLEYLEGQKRRADPESLEAVRMSVWALEVIRDNCVYVSLENLKALDSVDVDDLQEMIVENRSGFMPVIEGDKIKRNTVLQSKD